MKQNRRIFEAEVIPTLEFDYTNFKFVHQVEEIPWEDVQKGMFYAVYEESGTKVCDWVKATSNSFLNKDNIWTFNCELVEK